MQIKPQSEALGIPLMTEEAAVRREAVPMNILIVDDEQSIRETCATVSEQSGMKAIAVATAEEALEVLEHSAIDILLTDLKLQRTSGVELLKQVHGQHPEVAVVVLTQYGTIESALEVTRLGAVDYVTKPFLIEELRSRLERVSRAVELQQENRLLREQLRTRPGICRPSSCARCRSARSSPSAPPNAARSMSVSSLPLTAIWTRPFVRELSGRICISV